MRATQGTEVAGLAVEMERTARGEPTTVIEEHRTVESFDAGYQVEMPHDPGHLQEAVAILVEAGALDIAPDGRATLVERDSGHPALADQ